MTTGVDRLEAIDGATWEAFVKSPWAVLMLGKSDCPACGAWTDELTTFLETDQEWTHVRFGKVLLDRGGLIGFKRAHPWIAELDVLPFTQMPQTRHVRGSNMTYIGLAKDRVAGRAIICSALDNLTKGASGQAVQNMNLMLGFPETMGLEQIALFP